MGEVLDLDYLKMKQREYLFDKAIAMLNALENDLLERAVKQLEQMKFAVLPAASKEGA